MHHWILPMDKLFRQTLYNRCNYLSFLIWSIRYPKLSERKLTCQLDLEEHSFIFFKAMYLPIRSTECRPLCICLRGLWSMLWHVATNLVFRWPCFEAVCWMLWFWICALSLNLRVVLIWLVYCCAFLSSYVWIQFSLLTYSSNCINWSFMYCVTV